MPTHVPDEKLELIVKNRQKVLFQGPVTSVTTSNEKGVFDILPFHANYLTLTHGSLILDKGIPSEHTIALDKALLYVIENKVFVYAGL